jgi:hypothetical protein
MWITFATHMMVPGTVASFSGGPLVTTEFDTSAVNRRKRDWALSLGCWAWRHSAHMLLPCSIYARVARDQNPLTHKRFKIALLL